MWFRLSLAALVISVMAYFAIDSAAQTAWQQASDTLRQTPAGVEADVFRWAMTVEGAAANARRAGRPIPVFEQALEWRVRRATITPVVWGLAIAAGVLGIYHLERRRRAGGHLTGKEKENAIRKSKASEGTQ